MKSHAQVVIIGGGSLGVNLMYHLGLEGWTDVVLIEKGELTSGSTWHAAGLCPNFNGNHTLSNVHEYTIKLYDEILPKKTGLPSSFHKTGSLRVGYTEVEELPVVKNVGCILPLTRQHRHIMTLQECFYAKSKQIDMKSI